MTTPTDTTTAPHLETGMLGERIAERFLVMRGWRVLARRWRSGARDLDLVVTRGDLVAFVEVKARRTVDFGTPLAAVDARKRRELSRAAREWAATHGRPGEGYRFDVVGVVLANGRIWVQHIENAFSVN